MKHFVRIDILINNARVQEDIPLTENTFRRMVQNNSVDLTGPFICRGESVKHMKKQNSPKG